MTQTKTESLIEVISSQTVGILIGTFLNLLIIPMFPTGISFFHSFLISVFFMIVGVIKGFFIRRIFISYGPQIYKLFYFLFSTMKIFKKIKRCIFGPRFIIIKENKICKIRLDNLEKHIELATINTDVNYVYAINVFNNHLISKAKKELLKIYYSEN